MVRGRNNAGQLGDGGAADSNVPDVTAGKQCPQIAGIPDAGVLLQRLAMHPNPASDMLHITFVRPQPSTFDLMITDPAGQVNMTQSSGSKKSGRQYIGWPVSALHKGIYFLVIRTEAGKQSRKFIIK